MGYGMGSAVSGCSHSFPPSFKRCPLCKPPQLDAAPLIERVRRANQKKLLDTMQTRFGQSYDAARRHLYKLVRGRIRHVGYYTADVYAAALGKVPDEIWGEDWQRLTPLECYTADADEWARGSSS